MKSITLFFSTCVKLIKPISSHNFCSIDTKLCYRASSDCPTQNFLPDFWFIKNWAYSASRCLTVNGTVNIYLQILAKEIFNVHEKNWQNFGVMVDDVWQISEFYLKNWIFDSILNFALTWTIGVNARMAFLNISFSLMEPINHCYQHLHAV